MIHIVIWLNSEDVATYTWPAAPRVGDIVRHPDETPDEDCHLLEVKRVIWLDDSKHGCAAWLYCAWIGREEDDGLNILTDTSV